jgi:urea transport system permease protein
MRLTTLLLVAALGLAGRAALASPLDPALLKGLAAEDSGDKVAAVEALTLQAGPAAAPVLSALAEDRLRVAGERLLITEGDEVRDAATGELLPAVPEGAADLSANNRVRRSVEGALAVLRVFDPDRKVRLGAAQALGEMLRPDFLPIVEKALAGEKDPEIRELLQLAGAQVSLKSPEPAVRLAAVKALGSGATLRVKALLDGVARAPGEPDAAVREAARASLGAVEQRLFLADALNRIFSGLSLGSILLLAALGLAITYGVMGVINMAHGELLMVGAYAGYAVQTVFRNHFPGGQDWYVLAAVPVAFAAAFVAGVAMERTVIRHLYRRPLESLLATWGLSLVLIQAARVTFGAQNVQVANPSWMSGGVTILPSAVLPWNRIVIIGFSLGVLAVTWLLLSRTRLGMFVRAVTQNRAMAGCVGVPTGRVDTLAFGLGAGIAGLGGLALSQISNVGPDMGQLYIVDSFMVVVLGGVGQLAGAVMAALGLGVASKFLEGVTGAVVAKIVVLVFIIVFIQKRPQGLFALKGRTVEG